MTALELVVSAHGQGAVMATVVGLITRRWRRITFHNVRGQRLFMVALCNRADHYIFMLWFVLLLLLLFFPRLISAAADWMSAILPHMVWP